MNISDFHKHSMTAKGKQDELRAYFLKEMILKMEEKRESAKFMENPLLEDESEECKQCQAGVYDWVAKHTKAWLDHACKNPKKDLVDLCKLAEDHPHVVCGMLIYWTRPYQSAGAYCVGTKACPPPKDDEFEEPPEALADRIAQESWKSMSIDVPGEDIENAAAGHPEPSKECTDKVNKVIMGEVVESVKKWCEETSPKCKKAKKICEWAGQHKDVAFGWIMAAVEPWKFSYGYCYPRGGHKETAMESDAQIIVD